MAPKPGAVAARLRAEPRPARFVASRLLWRTRLCRRLQIAFPGRPYRLRFHPNAVSAALWVDPETGAEDRRAIASCLETGDTAVDVGANVGALTVEAAACVGRNGRVFAFEPNPTVFPYLTENVALNALSQVECLNYAVGDSSEPVRFDANPRSDEFSRVDPAGGIEVPGTTLDESIPPDASIALLKIDVEGYELSVLRGATQTLARTQRIYFEVSDDHFARFGYTTTDLLDLLRAQGFEIYRFDADGGRVPVGSDVGGWENLLAARAAS